MSAYDFLQAHVHELETETVPDDTISDDSPVEVDLEPPNTILYNVEKRIPPTPVPPGDIFRVLSKQSKQSTQLGLSNWVTLSIRYPTIKLHLDNPCHSLIEVRMEVLLVMMSVSSVKLVIQ
jgi:hypothetical protein